MTEHFPVTVFQYQFSGLLWATALAIPSTALPTLLMVRAFFSWRHASFHREIRKNRQWFGATLLLLLWGVGLSAHVILLEWSVALEIYRGNAILKTGRIERVECSGKGWRKMNLLFSGEISSINFRECHGVRDLSVTKNVSIEYVTDAYGNFVIIKVALLSREIS